MAEETAEERDARISDEARKLHQDQIDQQREEAEAVLSERHAEGPHIETQEEYDARVAAARTSGIFGDTDTTEGAGAVEADVVAADNEAATVAVAEADAQGLDVSDDEARRQASADAAVTEEGDVLGTDQTPEETEDDGDEPTVAESGPDDGDDEDEDA
jgi:hypothetical protein